MVDVLLELIKGIPVVYKIKNVEIYIGKGKRNRPVVFLTMQDTDKRTYMRTVFSAGAVSLLLRVLQSYFNQIIEWATLQELNIIDKRIRELIAKYERGEIRYIEAIELLERIYGHIILMERGRKQQEKQQEPVFPIADPDELEGYRY